MIREDYLIRVIRQCAEMLAGMIRRRERGDLQGAREHADQLYDALGIPRELVDVVDTPTLASLLRDPDKMRTAAKLLWEEGHGFDAGGDPLHAFDRYRRAHELFLEAQAASPEPDEDDVASIMELSRLGPAWQIDPRCRGS